MPNQRVVVLTDDQILMLQMAGDQFEGNTGLVVSCLASLQAALEHPEGITDEQRVAAINAAHDTMLFKTGLPDDFDSAKLIAEASIAALFPGDGEL